MKTKNIFFLSLLMITAMFACEEDETNNAKLGVDFSAKEQNISAGDAVEFTDLSIGSPSKWNWTFEGGTPPTSNLQNPTVVYETAGNYKVTLEVGYADNTASLTKEGFIAVASPAVVADFSASKTTAIQGENVVFTDLSTGSPTTWEWEFIPASGTPVTSSGQSPIVSFTEPGVYTVKLTASNADNSGQKVKADYLTVIDVTSVEADFTASTRNTYTGAEISFSDASVGTANSWSWTFEGGTPATSTEENPTVTYSTPGRYKVTLVASNDAKSSTKEADGYVLVIPGNDLAAFYPFDGNKNDAGPNNLAPENIGNVVFSGIDRHSAENNAAVFDGASVLVVPDHSAFNFETSDFSVGCWIRSDQTSKMMVWMESGGINGPGDEQAWLRLGDNSTDRKLRFAVEDNTGGKILNVADGVADDTWHYVVCVREGLTSRVYIDGNLITESDGPSIKDTSSDMPFKIGAQEDKGGNSFINYFTGQLDDMVIYNRALTATEISELFDL